MKLKKTKKKGKLPWVAFVLLLIALAPLTYFAFGKKLPDVSQLAANIRLPLSSPEIKEPQLYINCVGQGSPTVVMEAGSGEDSTTWSKIVPEISKNTRVCIYDRAGIGQSDKISSPQTLEEIVTGLHNLLSKNQINPPLVLVGHSMGGIYVRDYFQKYPNEVVGIVLVDPGNERLAVAPGVNNDLLKAYTDQMIGIIQQTKNPGWEGQVMDASNAENIWEQARQEYITSLGDIPLILLASDKNLQFTNSPEADKVIAKAWRGLQKKMADESGQGQFRTVKGTGHLIQLEKPQQVIKAIKEVMNTIASERTRPVEQWTLEGMKEYAQPTYVDVSPDGQSAVYAVHTPRVTKTESQNLTTLYLYDQTGHSRLLAGPDLMFSKASWSPDGKRIGFVKNIDGVSNVWIINPDNGSSLQLTNEEDSIIDFNWSPKGDYIAFVKADPQSQEEQDRIDQKNDAQVVDENLPSYRLWIQPAKASSKPSVLTPATYNVEQWDWSPDQTEIAYSYLPLGVGKDMQDDIAKVDIKTGAITVLANTPASETMPTYSPDGLTIAFDQSDLPASDFSAFGINLMKPDGSQKRALAETPGQVAKILGWSADGQYLYYAEVAKTSMVLGRLPINGGQPEIVSNPKLFVAPSKLNKSRTAIGLIIQSPTRPAEAYMTNLDIFQPKQISRLNSSFYLYPQIETKVINWRSTDGKEIEGILSYPQNFDPNKSYPLLTYVHGGPAGVRPISYPGACDIYPLPVFASQGYFVFRPNFRGSEGYGADFKKADIADWGGGDFQDIMTGIDYIIENLPIDQAKLGIMGWSYGGFMTSWAVGHTDRFKAASVGAGPVDIVSMAGTCDVKELIASYFNSHFWENYDLYKKSSPLTYVVNIKTPVLIQQGTEDVRVPPTQSQEFYAALEYLGVPTKLILYPRSPHVVNEPKLVFDVWQRNLDWFEKYIKP